MVNGKKAAAVIAEYNPFHLGHKYQLDMIRRTHEYIMVIMSGAFVQRGDAAVFDKRFRAERALEGGADLVAELPAVFAMNTAERFAFGGVSLADRTRICDTLFFGAETEDMPSLEGAAELIANEPPEVSAAIKEYLSAGMSYASARERAYGSRIKEGILSRPNNILAVEYIRALKALGSDIKPAVIKRVGAGHDTKGAADGFASASYIRELIREGKDVSALTGYDIKDASVYDISALDTAVAAYFRMTPPETIKKAGNMGEGLENRLLRAARENCTVDGICRAAKTARYTMSRIRRSVLCAYLGFGSEYSKKPPAYIRVLGANDRGFEMIKEIKRRSELTVITKAADYGNFDGMFALDIKAADAAALCASDKSRTKAGRDFTEFPVIKALNV